MINHKCLICAHYQDLLKDGWRRKMTNQEKVDFFLKCHREIDLFCRKYFSDNFGMRIRYTGFTFLGDGIRIKYIDYHEGINKECDRFLTWNKAIELGLFGGKK